MGGGYVVDLRTGKPAATEEAAPTGQQEDWDVSDLVLKRNGSVGWIGKRDNYDVRSPRCQTRRSSTPVAARCASPVPIG